MVRILRKAGCWLNVLAEMPSSVSQMQILLNKLRLDAQTASGGLCGAGCRLAGCGSSVPEAVLTNADLEKLVETNDDWIASRTGIRSLSRDSLLYCRQQTFHMT